MTQPPAPLAGAIPPAPRAGAIPPAPLAGANRHTPLAPPPPITPADSLAPNAPSAVVTLSPAGQAAANQGATLDEARTAARATRRLEAGAASARAEGDSLQQALKDLEAAFERLLRQFGLSDADSATGAEAGRQAVAERLDTRPATTAATPDAMRVTTSQTLVVEVREMSFSLSQEDAGGTTTVAASVQSVSITYRETLTLEALWQEADPLILDLDGNGIDVADPDASGMVFDLDGNGTDERTAWVAGNDAFLAMDRDGDGKITSGKELFGDQHGAADGFAELAKLDSNQDGAIDAGDEQWGALLLLHADGSTRGLEEAGISRILLNAIVPLDQRLGNAGRLAATGDFVRADGSRGTVGEVFLNMEV